MDIELILKKYGPMLSSKLTKELVDGGISDQAARKRVSRKTDQIKELQGLPFPKGAKFLFLEDQFGTTKFYDNLFDAINSSSPPYAAALSGLRAREGCVLKDHFPIICGAPFAQKKKVTSDIIMERFKGAKIIKEHDILGIGKLLILEGTYSVAYLRAALATENILLNSIQVWLGKMNMASPGKITTRINMPLPAFSTYNFDLVGPSYLRPLSKFDVSKGKLNPGFVVSDIILGKVLSDSDVLHFIAKCKTLSNLRNNRPFLPIFIADEFEPSALKLCRTEGIIATTPATLFGSDIAKALRELIKTLQNAAANAAVAPEKIEKLLNSLSKIDGAAKNVRGALFELIVGHLIKLDGYNIEIGKIVYNFETEEEAEIDVRGIKEKEVRVIECRGYQPTTEITLDDIKAWLKKVSVIFKTLKLDPVFHPRDFYFEFWTTGKFSPDALLLLTEFSEKTVKYKVSWKDGNSIRIYVKKLESGGIRKMLDEHYFNNPVTKNY